MNTKTIIPVIIGIIIFLSIISSGVNVENSVSTTQKVHTISVNDDHTLYVGGSGANNYTSIQQAIYDATNNTLIYVYPGVYTENIYIPKEFNNITLLGDDKHHTIIRQQRPRKKSNIQQC